MKSTPYDSDAYAWAFEQAALLRAGRFEYLDVENLAQEIESMGRRERRALVSELTRLLAHLLKWEFQPARRSRSWQLTIEGAQIRTLRVLDENPSLRSALDQLLPMAYADARRKVAITTGVDPDVFPKTCRYDFDEAIAFQPERL